MLYHELVMTSKEYMRGCMVIEAGWLVELAPRFYKKADMGKMSRAKRNEKIEPMFNRHAQDQDEWRLSKRKW